MVKEAEANAAEDARRREEIEVRNRTDSLIYSTERSLGELGAKLSDVERRNVEQALEEARAALGGIDVQRIRAAADQLSRAGESAAEAMGRAASEAGAQSSGHASGQRPSGPAEGEVVDAEVVDEEEQSRR